MSLDLVGSTEPNLSCCLESRDRHPASGKLGRRRAGKTPVHPCPYLPTHVRAGPLSVRSWLRPGQPTVPTSGLRGKWVSKTAYETNDLRCPYYRRVHFANGGVRSTTPNEKSAVGVLLLPGVSLEFPFSCWSKPHRHDSAYYYISRRPSKIVVHMSSRRARRGLDWLPLTHFV